MRTSSSSKVTAFTLPVSDLHRVCRDIAWSELHAMPSVRRQLAERLDTGTVSWSKDDLDIDSLARMQLATAAATWCNAYDAGFEDLFLAKRNTTDWAEVMRRARLAGAAHFTFSSSGSTGARKHIRHREDVLASEAMAWAQIVNADLSVQRIVLLVPTHHIYGFIWGVLLPHALGKPVIEAELSALPDLQTGDLIVAVPDQWAWLAQAGDTSKPWPSGVQGVSSTAPLASTVHSKLIANYAYNTPATDNLIDDSIDDLTKYLTDNLTDNFVDSFSSSRLSRLFQIYGSSETAGLAYRADPTAPYTLAPGRSRCVNAAGEYQIQLQLPNGAQATMAVQDELKWVNDTDFELLRRSDYSVQVGGHNVSPDWVVKQLLKNTLVKEASVRLSTNHKPPKLKAFLVLDEEYLQANFAAQQTKLEQWIADTLPHYATFSAITYGKELPKSASGKLSDWEE
jgi:long-chain acyl-CoA synthetase